MLYAVLIEDRHTDVEVELFRTKEAAIARCIEVYRESARDPECPTLLEINKNNKNVYWHYSVEGDVVHWLEVDDPK